MIQNNCRITNEAGDIINYKPICTMRGLYVLENPVNENINCSPGNTTRREKCIQNCCGEICPICYSLDSLLKCCFNNTNDNHKMCLDCLVNSIKSGVDTIPSIRCPLCVANKESQIKCLRFDNGNQSQMRNSNIQILRKLGEICTQKNKDDLVQKIRDIYARIMSVSYHNKPTDYDIRVVTTTNRAMWCTNCNYGPLVKEEGCSSIQCPNCGLNLNWETGREEHEDDMHIFSGGFYSKKKPKKKTKKNISKNKKFISKTKRKNKEKKNYDKIIDNLEKKIKTLARELKNVKKAKFKQGLKKQNRPFRRSHRNFKSFSYSNINGKEYQELIDIINNNGKKTIIDHKGRKSVKKFRVD